MNVLHILQTDVFLRVAADPNFDPKEVGNAFMWSVSEDGYGYWFDQWESRKITEDAIQKIRKMKEIVDQCAHRADTFVGMSVDVTEAYAFAEELDGLFFATNTAFFFSNATSAVAFKLRFGG